MRRVGPTAAPAQLGVRLTSLLDLPARLERLTGAAGELAARLLDARVVHGRTDPPPELVPWLVATFGSVGAVREQPVIKVTNLATLEATLFAPLRRHRPIDGASHERDLAAEVAATRGDPFCHPETGTPAGRAGRIRGSHVITGANAAMADAHHAVLVFDRHDPLDFDAALVGDLLTTARRWADLEHAEDAAAVNYALIWNCLWRAGGSIIHGHAQALLGPGPHYARLERLRRDSAHYAAESGGDLVSDVVSIHRALGLTRPLADGVTLVAHVTPAKERELLLVGSRGMDETDSRFAESLAHTLVGYRDRLGVRSFNVAVWRPPLADTPGWEWMPPLARIVDRGDPFERPSDIGAMELYATPIVASDPYEVLEALG